jgi:hypothetical protein
MRLRIFVTSRPELPIRLGFKKMERATRIRTSFFMKFSSDNRARYIRFLKARAYKIRVDRSLTIDWPGQENIQALVEMAVPLFIFAATVCRFVGDPRWDPKKRLATILESQTASQASKLDRTYLPILTSCLLDKTK